MFNLGTETPLARPTIAKNTTTFQHRIVLGIDPGPKQSAYLIWNGESQSVLEHGITDNATMRNSLVNHASVRPLLVTPVIEMIASYGMPVGKEVFETVLFIGRIVEIFAGEARLVYRKEIKLHFCETVRATDANIRRVLIDRFGEPGTKKTPGLLFGIKKDVWSALAVAVFWADKEKNGESA